MTYAVGTLVFVAPCHGLGEIVGSALVTGAGAVHAYRVRLPNGAVVRFEADALIPFVGSRGPGPSGPGEPPKEAA